MNGRTFNTVPSSARRLSGLTARTMVMVPVLAGCGSVSKPTRGGTAPGGTGSETTSGTTATTGSPVAISAIGSGRLAGETGTDKAFAARAEETDKAGGIDGTAAPDLASRSARSTGEGGRLSR